MNTKLLWFITAVQVHLLQPREDKDRGATATEYAILVAFIALVVVGGATLFGKALSKWFDDLATTVGGWAN